MRKTNKNKSRRWYLEIWISKRAFDMWSLNHFLLGAVLAGILMNTKLDYINGFILAILIMVGWEFWEIFRKMKESLLNRIFDVLLGISGFYFMQLFALFFSRNLFPFLIVFISYLMLELWGCWAFKKESKRFI